MNHLNITVLKKPQTLALKPPHVSSELTKLGKKKITLTFPVCTYFLLSPFIDTHDWFKIKVSFLILYPSYLTCFFFTSSFS